MDTILSIITPCYNSEKYIEEAIMSILNQDTTQIELILVDDGSTDNTAEKCSKYIGNNIKYIRTENAGAGHARNIGIHKAIGKWIAFLDSDDLYLAGSLNESFFNSLTRYELENTDIVCTPRLKTNMELTDEIIVSLPESIDEIQNHIPKLEFWTCIYRRSFLESKNIEFYEYQKQDVETAFRFRAFSATDKVKVNNHMVFYLQRNNLQSNTHTWNRYHLYEVRGLVYYDLYQQTSDATTKAYLLGVVVEQITAYYKLCIRYGCVSSVELENMHKLINEVKLSLKNTLKPVIVPMDFRLIVVLDIFYKLLKLRKCTVSNRQHIITIDEKDKIYSKELILKRLEKISVNF